MALPSAAAMWRLSVTRDSASSRYMSRPHASPPCATAQRRARGELLGAVAEGLERQLARHAFQQRRSLAVHARVDAADERERPPPVRCLQPVEDRGVEREAQVLAPHAEAAEALDEVRERREDEVVAAHALVARAAGRRSGRPPGARPRAGRRGRSARRTTCPGRARRRPRSPPPARGRCGAAARRGHACRSRPAGAPRRGPSGRRCARPPSAPGAAGSSPPPRRPRGRQRGARSRTRQTYRSNAP